MRLRRQTPEDSAMHPTNRTYFTHNVDTYDTDSLDEISTKTAGFMKTGKTDLD
jgi:hypothetical protein